MLVTQLTIKDKSATPAKLANFLKKYMDHPLYPRNLQDYLGLAKKIISGEIYTHDYNLRIPENEFVQVDLVEVLSDEEKAFRKRQEEYAHLTELMSKGANGDAQAAIEFCKAVQAGKYNNSAYACG